MTKEREEYLQKTFPGIYTNCGENHPYTLFGFECDDGWFNLLVRLSQYIQSYINSNNRLAKKYPENYKEIPQVKALQVKEKFRTLRFYYSGGDEYISGLTSMAESWAANTCETCGKPGKLRGGGWLYTACDEHTKPEDLETENTNG